MPKNCDADLAAEYGADRYGMRKYVIAFLRRGPNRDISEAEAAELQKEHLKNIDRMAVEGRLAVAGPFLDNGDLRGIYIFSVDSLEEAAELTSTDPAVKAGTLVMELKEWYGSAALMAVNGIHGKLERQSVSD